MPDGLSDYVVKPPITSLEVSSGKLVLGRGPGNPSEELQVGPVIDSRIAASGQAGATFHTKLNAQIIDSITKTTGNPTPSVIGDKLRISVDDDDWGHTVVRTNEPCWLQIEAGINFGIAPEEVLDEYSEIGVKVGVMNADFQSIAGESYMNPSIRLKGQLLDNYRDGSELHMSRIVSAPENAFVLAETITGNLFHANSGYSYLMFSVTVLPFGPIIGWGS